MRRLADGMGVGIRSMPTGSFGRGGSCSFEYEIIKIGQMYSNSILNFQESTTILNACTKKVWKLIEGST